MKINSFLFFFAVGLTLFTIPLMAQTELSWSRALIVTAEEIVPAGKVWKITNYLPSCALQLNNSDSSRDFTMIVNGNVTYLYGIDTAYSIFNGNPTTYGYSGGLSSSDFWIPEGTVLAPGNCVWGLSIVEFSVQ
jgi:hypothetical protein